MECVVGFYGNDKWMGTKVFNFIPVLDGQNFIAQSYEYLKALPEFADAVDC